MIDVRKEISFKFARSGGKGGQNVNKVETMVEGYWNINQSSLFTEEQKQSIHEKLKNKINSQGILIVKSQTYRTQLSNKEDVLNKFNTLLNKAIVIAKKRKATQPTKASKEKRIESKKSTSEKKESRKKIKFN